MQDRLFKRKASVILVILNDEAGVEKGGCCAGLELLQEQRFVSTERGELVLKLSDCVGLGVFKTGKALGGTTRRD